MDTLIALAVHLELGGNWQRFTKPTRIAAALVDTMYGHSVKALVVFVPLVRIDVVAGQGPGRAHAIANAVHGALVTEYGIPERDRFQVVTERATEQIVAEDAGLGFERGNGVVIIQIFTQRGRSADQKRGLYRRIAAELGWLGVAGEDIFIGYFENGPEDWSFAFGEAQYVTGELSPLTT